MTPRAGAAAAAALQISFRSAHPFEVLLKHVGRIKAAPAAAQQELGSCQLRTNVGCVPSVHRHPFSCTCVLKDHHRPMAVSVQHLRALPWLQD